MKETFRQSMAWLHDWAGLTFGWLLFLVFATGTLAVYTPEITLWTQPEARGGSAPPEQALAVAETYLRTHAVGSHEWGIVLPSERSPLLDVHWHDKNDVEIERTLDPATGKTLLRRETEGGEFYNRLHYELRGGRLGLGAVLVMGVTLLVLILTGIVVHKRIFKDFFTFRAGKGQRSWLDAHNLAGVMTIPFLLMIAYTGVTISIPLIAPLLIETRFEGNDAGPRAGVVRSFQREASGEPAPSRPLPDLYARGEAAIGAVSYMSVDHPGDSAALAKVGRRADWRIAAVDDHAALDAVTGEHYGVQTDWNPAAFAYRFMVGLHIAQFGGAVVRLLYFLSGLAGCVLIATGLVLFVEKRRERGKGARFLRFAAHLNVAAVSGVLIACAAFLWANRLLPAELAGQAGWEAATFYILWVVALLHAFVRPVRRAWVEQLAVAATLLGLLPVLSAVTVGAGLFTGDPIGIRVELTAVGAGVILGLAARRIARRPLKPVAGPERAAAEITV